MVVYLLMVLLAVSTIACGWGIFRLAGREKRFPGVIFMVEVIGRWWSVPRDRADPFVSSAVAGFAAFFATWILLLLSLW